MATISFHHFFAFIFLILSINIIPMEKDSGIIYGKPTHYWTIPNAACGPMVLLNKMATLALWPDEGKTPIVRIADIQTKKYKHLLAHKKNVTLLSLSRDETRLATLSDVIRIFDLNTGKSTVTCDTKLENNCILTLKWSSNDKVLSSIDANNKIQAWDTRTGHENREKIIQVHFINNMNANTALWAMAAAEKFRNEITDLNAIQNPKITKISPNKVFKAHATVETNCIAIHNAKSKELLTTINVELAKDALIDSVIWMDNDRIAVTTEDGVGGVFDAHNGKALHRYTSKGKRSGTEPAYANGTLAYGNLDNQNIEILRY